MLFYKVSSNLSGVRIEIRRESKNIKGLGVCGTGSDYCGGLAERGDVFLRSRIKPLWKGGEHKKAEIS